MLKRKLPPSHPGIILKEMFLDEHQLTITEAAEGLEWPCQPVGHC